MHVKLWTTSSVLAVGLLFSGAGQPAMASGCCGPIVAAVTEAGISIVQAIGKSAGQISGNIETAARAQAKLQDAQYQRTVERQRQQTAGQSAADFAPSLEACQTMTGASAASVANINATYSQVSQANKSIYWNDGTKSGGSNNNAVSTNKMMALLNTYCSPRDIEEGFCAAPPELSGAHLRPVSTILMPATYQTDGEAQAARDALTLLTNPIPSLPPPLDARNAEGRERLLRRDQANAMIGWGQGVAQRAISDRDRVKDTKWSTYMSEWIKGVFGGSAPSGVEKNTSKAGLLEAEVDRRYANPAWALSLRKKNNVELVREGLAIQALETHLLHLQTKKLDEISVSLALMVAERGEQKSKELAAQANEAGRVVATPTGDVKAQP